MMSGSAALFRAANLRILDYPFEAALASALEICDEAVVVVGQSEDDTLNRVMGLRAAHGADRVIVEQATFTFDLGWQERWWARAAALTDAEWLLWLDADEVIDPVYAPDLRRMMADPALDLIRFPFIHLYATPRVRIEFPLTHNTRLGRRSAGYRMRNLRSEANPEGAACAVVVNVGGAERSAHVPSVPGLRTVQAPIMHYGWCRNARALAISQLKQAAWYADGCSLADGGVPDAPPHDFELARMLASGRAEPFVLEHPALMADWFAEHGAEWRAIERGAGL